MQKAGVKETGQFTYRPKNFTKKMVKKSRLGSMNRELGVRISTTIQECNSCTNRGNNFKIGKQDVKEGFNINMMICANQSGTVGEIWLLSLNHKPLHRAAKIVRFVDSNRTSLVKKVWVNGEHREGFSRPRDSRVLDNNELHSRSLNEVGERYNLRWNTAPDDSEFLLFTVLDFPLHKLVLLAREIWA